MTNPVDHQANGRVVVKTGIHVTVSVSRATGRGRHAGYWRSCIPLATKEWLDEVVGSNTSQHEWELEGKGAWLHTGTTMTATVRGLEERLTAHFWFRDNRMAQLFILAWKNRL